MKRMFSFAAALAALSLVAAPAYAALAVGAKAPALSTQGAEAGKQISFSLTDTLKKGPVVLYFYPKANTGGCDLQAKLFSDASADFKAAGGQIVGASADKVETLVTYSAKADTCAGKFPVVSADAKAIEAFDVKGMFPGITSRTTYVIAPTGEILMSHTGAPDTHQAKALDAVKAWKAKHH
jgi:peroxiredoxin